MKSFYEKVYEALKKVPKGKVTTYKQLAKAVKSKAYRAVGTAMNKNPEGFCTGGNVPCHRVVNSSGEVGQFAHGQKKKIEMLKKEGVSVKNGKVVDFEEKLFRF